MFVDYAKVFVRAGRGGNGAVAFRREKHVPKGGPSGGKGGHGGDIIVKAVANLNTLQDLKYRKSYVAGNGEHGQGAKKSGQDGESVEIPVPLGTVIKNEHNNRVLADLTREDQTVVIAQGGRGGLGNAAFTTATRQAPRFAQQGEAGEEKHLIFELKLLSDVGLVGLPNCGKSTLIATLSNAKPKIASYPTTTISPNVGIVKYEEYQSFLMVDVPGLIKGAHKGKGMGHRFLRHLERTRLLVFMLESLDENPRETYRLLNSELNQHLPAFKTKNRLIVISKSDLVEEQALKTIQEIEVLYISAITGAGLNALIQKMTRLLNELNN